MGLLETVSNVVGKVAKFADDYKVILQPSRRISFHLFDRSPTPGAFFGGERCRPAFPSQLS